jgi:type II secretory pathway component PulM
MSVKVFQFWSALQTREKITVLTGASIVLLTAIYLLFDGIWSTRASLLQQKAALMEERGWMQEQAQIAGRLSSACRENQFLALADIDLLELLASRNQLVLNDVRQGSANGENTYAMQVDSMEGNNILRFIHQSACQGFVLANISIEKSETESFSGRLVLSHES